MHVDFTRLFKKISRTEFIDAYHDKQPYFEAGAFDDVGELFSWTRLNDLFERNKLWDSGSIELAVGGQVLPSAQYCRPGMGRTGDRTLKPDAERIKHFLRQGATLVLDFLEGIDPAIQATAACIERLTGTATSCNAYSSWKAVQGYASHFDTMCVFAIQIEGEKTWNIYRGRVREPMFLPGSRPNDFSREQHDRQKGPVMQQVVARPGDVLYLPRGQYHDAIATDSESLHLSFGATYLGGFSAVSLLIQDLQKEEFFRRRLPHFEDEQDLAAYLGEVGRMVAERMARPEFHESVRSYQIETMSEKLGRLALPLRDADESYFVTRRPPVPEPTANGARLTTPAGNLDVPPALMPVVEFVLAQEIVWSRHLAEHHPAVRAQVPGLLADLVRLKLIRRMRA